jgi:aspartate dehydrogenase
VSTPQPQRVGIVGLGPIGRRIAEGIDQLHGVDYVLSAVSARRMDPAREFAASLNRPPEVLAAGEVAACSDVVIECAPASIFEEIATPVVSSGKCLVVLSAGALLGSWHLVAEARRTGAQILVPSGALLGLDAVQAAALGEIHSVRMRTRKPPIGLLGAPHLVENDISLDQIAAPTCVFRGSARQAAAGFPANLNVAVALSLAGIGPDRTEMEIWADPGVVRNTHDIEVVSDSAIFTMTMENIPSENPKTGRITALSVLALLHKRVAPLRIGT